MAPLTPKGCTSPARSSRTTSATCRFDDAIDQTIVDFEDGDIVTGTVVKVDKDEVLLDIGFKSEGVIPARELSIRHDVDAHEVVSVGDEVEALVLQKEDKEGRLVLSKKRAQYERGMGHHREGQGVRRRRQGPGHRGRQGRAHPRHRPARLPARLARRAASGPRPPAVHRQDARGEDHRARQEPQQRRALPPGLARGDPEGAAWRVPRQPEAGRDPQGRRLLGRELRRLRRPRRDGRARARLRALLEARRPPLLGRRRRRRGHRPGPRRRPRQGADQPVAEGDPVDPWQEFATHHRVGELVYGRITKLVPFGAFVQVGDGIEGLVHISEMAAHHVDLPEQVVTPGEELWVKIIDIDLAAPQDQPFDQAGRRRRRGRRGVPRGFRRARLRRRGQLHRLRLLGDRLHPRDREPGGLGRPVGRQRGRDRDGSEQAAGAPSAGPQERDARRNARGGAVEAFAAWRRRSDRCRGERGRASGPGRGDRPRSAGLVSPGLLELTSPEELPELLRPAPYRSARKATLPCGRCTR